MSYKLYLDKNNIFECDVQIQGTSINNSFARIILEAKKCSYVFNGKIDENGHCSIEMNKLKDILENSETGSMKLEVIAEDIYFNPWNSEFVSDLSKKIDVIIKEQVEPSKPTISVSVKDQPPQNHSPKENVVVVENREKLTVKEIRKLIGKK